MIKTLSIVGYLVMAGGLVGLFFTHALFSPSAMVIAPQMAAVALLLWARFTFRARSFHFAADPTEGGLVTTGPYRHIRHPIYTAACLFATAGAATHASVSTGVLLGLVWVGALTRLLCEERLLVVRYPEYREYAASTPRMVPFVF